MSILTILLKEIVIQAVKRAILEEFGEDSAKLVKVFDDPEAAAKKIAENETAKSELAFNLTKIFRTIIRVFK